MTNQSEGPIFFGTPCIVKFYLCSAWTTNICYRQPGFETWLSMEQLFICLSFIHTLLIMAILILMAFCNKSARKFQSQVLIVQNGGHLVFLGCKNGVTIHKYVIGCTA